MTTNPMCEHFEIEDTTCCEYCNAYPKCPLHNPMIILARQVRKNWEDFEPIREDFSDNDDEDEYDYTEGDIGQDGEI